MNYFKAIRGSILPNALNKRFKMIVDTFREVMERLAALEAGTTAVTVQTDEQEQTRTDDNEQDYTTADIIDEKSPDHPVRVEAKAKGVSSWHVKSIDTLTAELAELSTED